VRQGNGSARCRVDRLARVRDIMRHGIPLARQSERRDLCPVRTGAILPGMSPQRVVVVNSIDAGRYLAFGPPGTEPTGAPGTSTGRAVDIAERQRRRSYGLPRHAGKYRPGNVVSRLVAPASSTEFARRPGSPNIGILIVRRSSLCRRCLCSGHRRTARLCLQAPVGRLSGAPM
jgi:hypothetical protein